tara:strand:+ start:143 stop:319 length:177 start_codon:yes stop_codon:yes gene_type:complete
MLSLYFENDTRYYRLTLEKDLLGGCLYLWRQEKQPGQYKKIPFYKTLRGVKESKFHYG